MTKKINLANLNPILTFSGTERPKNPMSLMESAPGFLIIDFKYLSANYARNCFMESVPGFLTLDFKYLSANYRRNCFMESAPRR
jgi:hypothetical protein